MNKAKAKGKVNTKAMKQSKLFAECDTGMNTLITPICVNTEINSLINSDTEMNSLVTASGSQEIINFASGNCETPSTVDMSEYNSTHHERGTGMNSLTTPLCFRTEHSSYRSKNEIDNPTAGRYDEVPNQTINKLDEESDTGMNTLITPFCASTEMNSLTSSDIEMNSLITTNRSI